MGRSLHVCNPPRLLNADKEASRETHVSLNSALAPVKYVYVFIRTYTCSEASSTKERVNQTHRARPADRRTHLAPLGCTSQRSRSPASGQKLYTLDLSYDLLLSHRVTRILIGQSFKQHCCHSCTIFFFFFLQVSTKK